MKSLQVFLFLTLLFAIIKANPTPASQTDNFQITDYVEITRNEVEARKAEDTETQVEEYLKQHDFTLKLPIVSSELVFTGRNLENGELDVKLRFSAENETLESRGKKHKLKKIFVPIFIFVLIKAMVLIPLGIGILAIKTWNALQLSFVSFVVALGLGVWQLCKKVAGDNAHPQIIAHSDWDTAKVARSIDGEAQKLAYSAYATK